LTGTAIIRSERVFRKEREWIGPNKGLAHRASLTIETEFVPPSLRSVRKKEARQMTRELSIRVPSSPPSALNYNALSPIQIWPRYEFPRPRCRKSNFCHCVISRGAIHRHAGIKRENGVHVLWAFLSTNFGTDEKVKPEQLRQAQSKPTPNRIAT
jgi:hypothetical protein